MLHFLKLLKSYVALNVCLFISISVFSITAFAQPKLVTFTFYGNAQGMLAENINAFVQDDKGFMWIGSSDGLLKFDGRTFKLYRKNDNKNAIPGNSVKSLVLLNSKLWIATNEGLCTYQDDRFFTIPNLNKINFNALNTMAASADGFMYLAFDKDRLLKFDTKSKQPVFSIISNKILTTYALYPLDKNHLITGHIGTSILCYVDNKKVATRLGYQKEQFKFGYTITAIARDNKNQYWCGAWDNGLHCFNTNLTHKESFVFNNMPGYNSISDEITCLAFINDSCLWFGTKNNGLFEFNTYSKTLHPIQAQHELPQRINTIYVDKLKRIWIGTPSGLALYDPHQTQIERFKLTTGQGKKLMANCFIRYNDTVLLIGTQSGIVVNTPTKQYLQPLTHRAQNQAVFSMAFDFKNRLIVGTNQTILRMHS
ncbi:MAG TPA: hypothetical protein PLO59_03335, partial [Bacteroidia bacterium]|nr:hypothetical protein [Bacteroidia bacterium]